LRLVEGDPGFADDCRLFFHEVKLKYLPEGDPETVEPPSVPVHAVVFGVVAPDGGWPRVR
jgi:hypothetical protein